MWPSLIFNLKSNKKIVKKKGWIYILMAFYFILFTFIKIIKIKLK